MVLGATLLSDPARSEPGFLAMVEMEWRQAEVDGVFSDDYFAGIASKIATFRGQGRAVVLGLGLHYSPADVKTIQPMVDNLGNVSSKANIVFSQTVRDRVERYIRKLAASVNLNDNVYAIRIATSCGQGEIQYPDQRYWAFSSGAQNGADKPTGLAPNPLPLPWKPGTSATPVAQVEAWSRWYIKALASSCEFQCDVLRSVGYRGWYYWVCAGSGERPARWATDVSFKLTGQSLIGLGVAYDKLFAAVANRAGVVPYCSSTAQNTSSWSVTQPGDTAVAVAAAACDAWPAARWMTRVANEHAMPCAGENPGYGNPPDPTYVTVMMDRAVDQARAGGWQSLSWAHDPQLWGNPSETSFARFAGLISAANAGAVPIPTYPGEQPMAITATLTTDKATYVKGETITATYAVDGAAAVVNTITGAVTVDGAPAASSAVVTVSNVVVFGAPTAPGLTFVATPDPKVWKATA